tara:strand:+ start:333 stop:635 length:303 start_codon:yes stop_codon:yes gene_type:complete
MHQNVKKVPKQSEQEAISERDGRVVSMVLDLLGEPTHYFGTTVRNVFSDKWRVNVWTQHWNPDMTTPTHRIAHSFFLTIQNGEIVCSVPPIIKLEEEDGV